MANSQKILLTGHKGNLGNIIKKYINVDTYNIDYTDKGAVREALTKQYDVIIHCAIKGANNTLGTDYSIVHDNLDMFYNILEYSGNSRILNIASGAELPSGYNVPESALLDHIPTLPYGLSKNIIAREVLKHNNCYNLRLFGIITNIKLFEKVRNTKGIFRLYDDRFMDYIHVSSFIDVLEYYCKMLTVPKDINMVYKEKELLSTIVNRYIDYNKLGVNLLVTNSSDKHYTGSGKLLDSLGII